MVYSSANIGDIQLRFSPRTQKLEPPVCGTKQNHWKPEVLLSSFHLNGHALRACSHGGGGPQVDEVPHLPGVRKNRPSHATPGRWGEV